MNNSSENKILRKTISAKMIAESLPDMAIGENKM
jgi:hypothetical protein